MDRASASDAEGPAFESRQGCHILSWRNRKTRQAQTLLPCGFDSRRQYQTCGCSSIGRAPAFQAGCCGFKPRCPLHRRGIGICPGPAAFRSKQSGSCVELCTKPKARANMLAVAQLEERRIVAPEVAGSSPVSHPMALWCSWSARRTVAPKIAGSSPARVAICPCSSDGSSVRPLSGRLRFRIAPRVP